MAKKEKTVKNKTGTGAKVLKIIALVVTAVLGILFTCFGVGSIIGKGLSARVKDIPAVDYTGIDRLTPEYDEVAGAWTFTTDRDFRILQLTDVHIGSGFLSASTDTKAITAVQEIVTRVKPDLVILTGDMAYPIVFLGGSIDNVQETKIVIDMMKSLDVYYTIAFGNHDTEYYAYYNREQVANMYADKSIAGDKCLFTKSPAGVTGMSNQVINIKNTAGEITESLFMLDSHSYRDNKNVFDTLNGEYDSIHDDQVHWYKAQLTKLEALNGGVMPKSLLFFHIPLLELQEIYLEYLADGRKNIEGKDFKFLGGIDGEEPKDNGNVVFSSTTRSSLFPAVLEMGSTQAMFFGHDHLNTFSMEYKGIEMAYGMSIDYLAYSWFAGFNKKTFQRGGTIITVHADGSYSRDLEPLVKDK